MSGDLETIRRIRAWHEGRPLPRGSVINVHVGHDDDVLVVAFLRMGGESRPWGIALGTLSSGPTIFSVPEARNRDLVGDMLLEAAPSFLAHFRHPAHHADGPGSYEHAPLRQLWLPGSTHRDMLHFLAAAYARTTWDRPGVETLRALGNLCNCLFIESQRPGQQTVVSATDALRAAYSFPTSPVRQGHVGHLLGWLRGGRTRDERLLAAHDAERYSVATSLDPEVERRELQSSVESWGESRRAGDIAAAERDAARIADVLRPALLERWNLTARAIRELRADERSTNRRLGALVGESAKQLYHSWGTHALSEAAGVKAWWPNVFTDHDARHASAAYHQRSASDDQARFALLHGDRELQREELAAGHGAIATVESVAPDEWRVSYSYPELTTLEAGKSLVIGGQPELEFEIISIDLDEKAMVLRPKWKLPKRSLGSNYLASGDPAWKRRNLVLLPGQPTHLALKRIANSRQAVADDITALLVSPRSRHAAYDEEGPVVADIEGGA